jgi:hypothetical protein
MTKLNADLCSTAKGDRIKNEVKYSIYPITFCTGKIPCSFGNISRTLGKVTYRILQVTVSTGNILFCRDSILYNICLKLYRIC